MYQREFRRLNSLLRVFKKWKTLVTIITTSPTSPHHHVTTSPHHHITTSPRHHITTSQHHHITSPCPHVLTSPHLTHHPITSHHHITSCFINLQSSHCRSQWDRFVKLTLMRVETHKTLCFLAQSASWCRCGEPCLCDGCGFAKGSDASYTLQLI